MENKTPLDMTYSAFPRHGRDGILQRLLRAVEHGLTIGTRSRVRVVVGALVDLPSGPASANPDAWHEASPGPVAGAKEAHVDDHEAVDPLARYAVLRARLTGEARYLGVRAELVVAPDRGAHRVSSAYVASPALVRLQPSR